MTIQGYWEKPTENPYELPTRYIKQDRQQHPAPRNPQPRKDPTKVAKFHPTDFHLSSQLVPQPCSTKEEEKREVERQNKVRALLENRRLADEETFEEPGTPKVEIRGYVARPGIRPLEAKHKTTDNGSPIYAYGAPRPCTKSTDLGRERTGKEPRKDVMPGTFPSVIGGLNVIKSQVSAWIPEVKRSECDVEKSAKGSNPESTEMLELTRKRLEISRKERPTPAQLEQRQKTTSALARRLDSIMGLELTEDTALIMHDDGSITKVPPNTPLADPQQRPFRPGAGGLSKTRLPIEKVPEQPERVPENAPEQKEQKPEQKQQTPETVQVPVLDEVEPRGGFFRFFSLFFSKAQRVPRKAPNEVPKRDDSTNPESPQVELSDKEYPIDLNNSTWGKPEHVSRVPSKREKHPKGDASFDNSLKETKRKKPQTFRKTANSEKPFRKLLSFLTFQKPKKPEEKLKKRVDRNKPVKTVKLAEIVKSANPVKARPVKPEKTFSFRKLVKLPHKSEAKNHSPAISTWHSLRSMCSSAKTLAGKVKKPNSPTTDFLEGPPLNSDSESTSFDDLSVACVSDFAVSQPESSVHASELTEHGEKRWFLSMQGRFSPQGYSSCASPQSTRSQESSPLRTTPQNFESRKFSPQSSQSQCPRSQVSRPQNTNPQDFESRKSSPQSSQSQSPRSQGDSLRDIPRNSRPRTPSFSPQSSAPSSSPITPRTTSQSPNSHNSIPQCSTIIASTAVQSPTPVSVHPGQIQQSLRLSFESVLATVLSGSFWNLLKVSPKEPALAPSKSDSPSVMNTLTRYTSWRPGKVKFVFDEGREDALDGNPERSLENDSKDETNMGDLKMNERKWKKGILKPVEPAGQELLHIQDIDMTLDFALAQKELEQFATHSYETRKMLESCEESEKAVYREKSLMHIKLFAAAQEELIAKCETKFQEYFSNFDRIQSYLHLLMANLNGRENGLNEICEELLRQLEKPEMSEDFEHRLAEQCEVLQHFSAMAKSARAGLTRVEGGFTTRVPDMLVHYEKALHNKRACHEQYRALCLQDMSTEDVDRRLGCNSTADQAHFLKQCNALNLRSFACNKLRRLQDEYDDLSEQRLVLEDKISMVTRRFLTQQRQKAVGARLHLT